jgi:membrane associated rhomboid family serine protease
MSVSYADPRDEPPQNAEPPSDEGNDEGAVRASPAIPYFTLALTVSLIAVYLTQVATGINDSISLADSNHLLIRGGEYWRLVTGATMHSNETILHVFFNCMALYNLGGAIEYLSNRAHLAIVFLFAVAGGGLLSLFLMPGSSAVGASGGIVGLLGYLAVYGYKRRRLLPRSFLRTMVLNIFILAGMGVIFYQFIDNGAHFGGLLVGACYGALQIPSDLHRDPREVDGVTAALGYITLIAFIGFAILTILVLTRKIVL